MRMGRPFASQKPVPDCPPGSTAGAVQAPAAAMEPSGGSRAVLRNRPFLLLWLAQLSTQVGGNMVIYGLILILGASYNSTAISGEFLCFLLPAIIFGAMAGVFVDRFDKRLILVVTNVMRGVAYIGIVLAGSNLILLYALMVVVATVTTFFAPAEGAIIPSVVPRSQLLAANGLFTLTTNIALALGLTLLGPFVAALSSAQILIIIVGLMYFVAAAFCWTLPSAPPAVPSDVTAGQTVADAEKAVESMLGQFVEGITYIRRHRNVGWSLSYLGVTGALVGILGVIGSDFATKVLGLGKGDFAILVVPLGLGIATGILLLGSYGRLLPRRRTIEAGMVGIGVLLTVLSQAGPIATFLENRASSAGLAEASRLVSALSLVVGIAFFVGIAYSVVVISAQTQLQEDLPEDVRGRVFGVLNMLVSITSLAPIMVVGPVADVIGAPNVFLAVGVFVLLSGSASIVSRGSPSEHEAAPRAPVSPSGAFDPLTVATQPAELTAPAAGVDLAAAPDCDDAPKASMPASDATSAPRR
jgi:MFS family permease